MASEEIKNIIRDFVKFDIENNYYDEEQKKELVEQFEKILFEDDVTVRKFLKSLFMSTKDLADQYSLIGREEEAVEEPTDEPEEMEDSVEEPEDSVEDISFEESKKVYRTIAANILYD
ncbi:MAG: hypothetical protein ACOC1O_04540 [bacterium]